MRVNAALHAKLDQQIRDGAIDALYLSHDEIDEWRDQFDIAIPVALLSYKGIPIEERRK